MTRRDLKIQAIPLQRQARLQTVAAFLLHCRESYEDNILTIVRMLFTTAERPVKRPFSAAGNPLGGGGGGWTFGGGNPRDFGATFIANTFAKIAVLSPRGQS